MVDKTTFQNLLCVEGMAILCYSDYVIKIPSGTDDICTVSVIGGVISIAVIRYC